MEIKVLGPGCPNCKKMEELAKAAIKEIGIDATVGKVSDIAEIMKYTMSTPGAGKRQTEAFRQAASRSRKGENSDRGRGMTCRSC
ncbi:MAG: thioredoxin family protein [Candidatus Sulfobium sp.]|jgi:hypothetical protein